MSLSQSRASEVSKTGKCRMTPSRTKVLRVFQPLTKVDWCSCMSLKRLKKCLYLPAWGPKASSMDHLASENPVDFSTLNVH